MATSETSTFSFSDYLAKKDADLSTSQIIQMSGGVIRAIYFPKTKTFTSIYIVDFDEPVTNNPVFEADSYEELEKGLCDLITKENSNHDIIFYG